MSDNIDDVIKFGAKTVKEVHHKLPIGDRRVNVGEQIREGLQFLTIVMNREIANPELAEFVLQLNGSRFFVITEQVFQ